MTIEVRQLLVKASALERYGSTEPERPVGPDWEHLKQEILAECQERMLRMLQDARER